MTEDEMVGWHHRLEGHEFEQALGVGDGHHRVICKTMHLDRAQFPRPRGDSDDRCYTETTQPRMPNPHFQYTLLKSFFV